MGGGEVSMGVSRGGSRRDDRPAGGDGARDGRQSAEKLVKQAGDDAERLKALPQDTWDAMLRRARFYAQAGWSRQKVETWSLAIHAASGQITIPTLDALAVAVDG